MSSAAAASAVTDPPTHTLTSLSTHFGPATMDEVLSLIEGHSQSSLVADGARVATARVSTDAARIYGEIADFFARASEAQRDLVPAFSDARLRISVWAALEGDRRSKVVDGTGTAEATSQSAAAASAETLATKVLLQRDQIHAAIEAVVAGHADQIAKLATAYGSAKDPAASVSAQVLFARSLLADSSASTKKRLHGTRITTAYLDRLAANASTLETLANAAKATRSTGALTQADVDLLDGINLVLLKSAVQQLSAAHQEDPSVPNVAFNSLRSHVHRKHHVAPPATPPATT